MVKLFLRERFTRKALDVKTADMVVEMFQGHIPRIFAKT